MSLAAVMQPLTAAAHAEYESSVPAKGAVVPAAPDEVSITFDTDIQTIGLSIEVTHDGASVTDGDAQREAADHTTASVPLDAGLAPGRYVVEWTNVSDADGDAHEGAFSFYIQTQPTAEDLEADEALEDEHHEMPTGTPHAGETPVVTAPDESGYMHEQAPVTAPAILLEGSVAVVMAPLNNSGVTGTAVARSLDGGNRSEITVVLSGLEPNTSHMTHVHVGTACVADAAQLGAHLVDLTNVQADASGRGTAITVADVPFATVANGQNKVVSHMGAAPTTDADKMPIACGAVPAIHAEGHSESAISAPQTGSGPAAGGSHSMPYLLGIIAAGLAFVAVGAGRLAGVRAG
jgi:methionine-rich copper-binding protein CopC